MTVRGRLITLLAAAAVYPMANAVGQGQVLLVRARRADADSPIEGAVVRAALRQVVSVTDRRGIARLAGLLAPDTIVVSAVGFASQRLPVTGGAASLDVRLAVAAVRLTEVTTSVERAPLTSAALTGAWVLSRQALEAVPAAVEPDPIRALALVPSVSFSSPLSARPIIRGYDAAETIVRLDGFDLHNPYHIGRVFSSLPAQALASAAVRPLPSPADAGTLGGVVDLEGRVGGGPTPLSGGWQASLVSVSGWLASGKPALFVAPRVAFLKAATRLFAQDGVPYAFQDVYASARTGLSRNRYASWTFFATQDDFGDRSKGSGMSWHNLLLGTRWHLLDGRAGGLDFAASINRFALNGTRVALSGANVDLENTNDRLYVSLEGQLHRGPGGFDFGIGVGRRETVAVVSGAEAISAGVASADRTSVTEIRSHLEGSLGSGPLRFSAGLLLDATAGLTLLQPRARAVARLSQRVVTSFTFARTSRPFQVLTDPQGEPTLSFFEVWRDAGAAGIPMPRIDHAALSIDASLGAWALHATAFGSHGVGIGEPRPSYDPNAGQNSYRFGGSRTSGLEFRAAHSPATPTGGSWAATYVLSWSQRNFHDRWAPWRLDRRHQLRLQAEAPLGRRWMVYGVGESASGQPVTPVEEVVWIHRPPSGDPQQPLTGPSYRFGPEGSSRSAPTYHLSVGVRAAFNGPFGLHTTVAASVTNLTFGPVAPEEPMSIAELYRFESRRVSGVPLMRRYKVPAVPSILFAIVF